MSDSKQLGFAGASPAGLRGLKRLQRGPGGHVGWRSFVPQEGAWAGQVQNSLQGHKTGRSVGKSLDQRKSGMTRACCPHTAFLTSRGGAAPRTMITDCLRSMAEGESPKPVTGVWVRDGRERGRKGTDELWPRGATVPGTCRWRCLESSWGESKKKEQ